MRIRRFSVMILTASPAILTKSGVAPVEGKIGH
jgi:hypothetical protein